MFRKLKLRSDRKTRERWDAGLVWHRLRYQDAAGLRRAVELLSRPQAAGRVALHFAPEPQIARLYIGVPEAHATTLQRMARNFAFTVREAVSGITPPVTPMLSVNNFPWERTFIAHIVNGQLFLDKEEASGLYLPQVAPQSRHEWRFLSAPPPGLSLYPSWNGHLENAVNGNKGRAGEGWPLGWGVDRAMVYAPGAVNVYGRQEAVAAWLIRLVSHLLATDPGRLIVLDGRGDLVPALKRKSLVTRHLGRELTYVDIDGATVVSGFNPLAATLGETEAETVTRWQQWFASMNVHPAGLKLLEEAQRASVTDLPALQRWLEQPAQQHRPAATRALQAALKRLLSDPHTREWLSWPTDLFAGLPAGSLLFACSGQSPGRRALLQAAFLAACQIPEARLVLHGLPWQALPATILPRQRQMLLSNGPLLPDTTVLLSQSGPAGARVLAKRFLDADPVWQERLELLAPGEIVILRERRISIAKWEGNR